MNKTKRRRALHEYDPPDVKTLSQEGTNDSASSTPKRDIFQAGASNSKADNSDGVVEGKRPHRSEDKGVTSIALGQASNSQADGTQHGQSGDGREISNEDGMEQPNQWDGGLPPEGAALDWAEVDSDDDLI